MNPIADKIRTARLKAKMSEKQLAKKCGLAETYIKQVESGKKVINEQTAQVILNVLKVDADILNQGAHIMRSEPELNKKPVEKTVTQVVQKPAILEPNDQWSDALAHIIKQIPVIELATGKVVDTKQVPMLGKSIEGCQWEKVKYYRMNDDSLAHLRVRKNDVVTVCETVEIINGKLMLVDIEGRRLLRQVWKENKGSVLLSDGSPQKDPIPYPASRVKVLGKCVKVEFNL